VADLPKRQLPYQVHSLKEKTKEAVRR